TVELVDSCGLADDGKVRVLDSANLAVRFHSAKLLVADLTIHSSALALGSAQKALDELVHGYQKRGWWIARTEEELQQLSRSTRSLPPSVVFMITGTNRRRDRLVVDLRRANRSSTRDSSSSVRERLYVTATMWVMDCSRAFYKLRWVDLLALLIVRSKLFTSGQNNQRPAARLARTASRLRRHDGARQFGAYARGSVRRL
ncbi:hypothetical protein FOZ61_004660, partial [Perkinsus olseni]